MMTQQNFKELNKQLLSLKFRTEAIRTAKPKSFRSKMFQQKIIKPNPKVFDKQIELHNPRYQKYLQIDLKLQDGLEIPHIWGCVIPQPRKIQSPRKNYLKRDIDTPKNLFRTYINRKNRLMFGIPIIKKVQSQQKKTQTQQINPQQNQDQIFQEEVSKFFTQIKNIGKSNEKDEREKFNKTTREKVKRYSDEEPQKFKFSKFFTTKPGSSSCTSRFSQILYRNEGNQKGKERNRFKIDNKSLYEMSVDELRCSIEWKKRFLNSLNLSLIEAKRSVQLK